MLHTRAKNVGWISLYLPNENLFPQFQSFFPVIIGQSAHEAFSNSTNTSQNQTATEVRTVK
jgi:hypothetical protein